MPALNWNIQQNSDSLIVSLDGELTRDTLLPLWKQRAAFLHPAIDQRIYWDLRQVKRIDSAGFALLAELLHHYRANANSLLNAPMGVKTLAELFNLGDWLASYLIQDKP